MMLFDSIGETTGMTGLILFFQVLPLANRLFQTRSEYHCVATSLAAKRIELKKALAKQVLFSWRRHPDLNRGIRVLQTLALPLGYSAL